jgi:FkbH-like protein
MYETEANIRTASPGEIPPGVLSAFGAQDSEVTARTLLPWSEHCTECVWPTCYTTCDLYEPREDSRCRRFVDGMVRIENPKSLNSYLLRIRFKRWGKLWAPGSLRLHSMEEAQKLEQRDHRIGTTLYQLPLPSALKRTVVGKRYSFKKRVAQRSAVPGNLPDSFLLECFNPGEQTVPLSLTIRSMNRDRKIPFQKLIQLRPGFNRERVPVAEISCAVDLASPFSIEMIPNEVPEGTTLYFGALDFVREAGVREKKTVAKNDAKKVKCVVWDLDNTMWDGILVEDGPEKLRLKRGVTEVIQDLDRRGILHSIASKNNHEEALKVLKKFQLDEYFVFPQISWNPKSESVKTIARELNIGMNTLLFIDDSPFELQEIQTACPGVRVVPAGEYLTLPDKDFCQVPVTEEAKGRRKMYQVDMIRQATAASFGQDYMVFLRQCHIKLHIRPLTNENLDRVHELTQRTNQMNFSGNRYSRELLQGILATDYLDTFVLSCEDRFGGYGVIGFSMVDRREPRMIDLMFSCRVQSKRVEHAFLGYLIRKYTAESGREFAANYRKTDLNAPSGAVFADIGMKEMGVTDGVTSLAFPMDQAPPDDEIVQILTPEDAVAAGPV